MSRALIMDGLGKSPPNLADNLKTGFLVSAFKDSDDMEGYKFETPHDEQAAASVRLLLIAGYETVMVERRRPATP